MAAGKPVDPQARKLAVALFNRARHATLATATKKGNPEAATILFAPASPNGLDLYFETFTQYRKYANLKSNPQVALVLTEKGTSTFDTASLQLEGKAVEVKGDQAAVAKKAIAARYHTTDVLEDARVCFFKFTPTWARLLDYETGDARFRELKV